MWLKEGRKASLNLLRRAFFLLILPFGRWFFADSGLSVLSSLVRLQYLNLASCSKLTDSCLQHVTGQSFYVITAVRAEMLLQI